MGGIWEPFVLSLPFLRTPKTALKQKVYLRNRQKYARLQNSIYNMIGFWIKIVEKHVDGKETQRVHPEGDQPWDFFGRTDAKAETPVLWAPHAKRWLIEKDSDAGRDWGQEEKGMTEDEMAGWHHWLDGWESEWTPGDGDGQWGLAFCDSWGHKESHGVTKSRTRLSDWAELNWTER